MKIIVKTLQNKQYEFNIDPNQLVIELKNQITKEIAVDVAQQKLILFGKVLEDQNKLSSYNIKENDFMVLMISTKKKEEKKIEKVEEKSDSKSIASNIQSQPSKSQGPGQASQVPMSDVQ